MLRPVQQPALYHSITRRYFKFQVNRKINKETRKWHSNRNPELPSTDNQPENLCHRMLIIVTTSLEQHQRHTLSPSIRTCSALQVSLRNALYKCTITCFLTVSNFVSYLLLTVSDVCLKRICALNTTGSVFSALKVLDDNCAL